MTFDARTFARFRSTGLMASDKRHKPSFEPGIALLFVGHRGFGVLKPCPQDRKLVGRE
jgi:hypothetical protein